MASIKGGLGGLAIALVILALNQYGIPQKYGVMIIPQFIAAAPAYLALRLSLTGMMMPIIYFAYWILAGAIIGWWLDKPIWGKIFAFGLIVALFYAHYHALLVLGDQVSKALTEFGRIF